MRPRLEKITLDSRHSFRCFRRQEAAFPFQWHHHPELELTLIESGRGHRFVGDHIATYRPGDLVLLGGGPPHTWRSQGGGRGRGRGRQAPHRAVVLQFAPERVAGALWRLPEMAAVRRLFAGAVQGLAFTGPVRATIAERMAALPDLPPARQLAELIGILARLPEARCEALASPGFEVDVDTENRRRIDRVCQYLLDHYTEDIAQPQVAARAGLSSAAFSRFFRRMTGKTFQAYLRELRTGHACRLLIEEDAPIIDICYASGFNNLSNFNRCFARLRGCTPSAYRRQYRG